MPHPLKFLLASLLLSVTTAQAAETAPPKRWVAGDYGPVVSTHMDAGGRELGQMKQLNATDPKELGNFVFRGRLISLGKDKSVNLCFDTDLLRVAAVWSGGYVDWEGAFKNMGPAIDGKIMLSTAPGPGWTPSGSWEDPREVPEGPLPADFAHYRGLYLHSDEVVLSYTVGECPVLEHFAGRTEGDAVYFARELNLGPSSRELRLLVCEGESAPFASGIGVIAGPAGRIFVGLAGEANGARVDAGKSRLHVDFPPRSEPARVTVLVGVGCSREQFERELARTEAPDLTPLTKGGPAHWTEVLKTQGELNTSTGGAYAVDELTAPDDNPWNSWLRFGALDFFPDGRAAISTWDGDVWIVSGIDDDLKDLRWKRFATGLQQPLGLKIIDGVIYCAGRDQITRLHDLNGDGEADYYENFNNAAGLTPQRHEYVMGLHTDAAGNLYYCRSGHYMPSQRGENCCVIRVSPDGKTMEVIARGLREANGMSIGPDGFMTVGDNEGNGIPQTPIYKLEPGAYYGFRGALREGEEKTVGKWQPPLVWLPKEADISAGGQAWVTSEKWGLLKGHLLHTSYGNCRLFHVMLDRVGDTWQGAAVPFPLVFTSGIMRGRFSPTDGQLYLCGLRGWGTSAAKESTFCRVRYTGRPLDMPVNWKVTEDGVALTFDRPLDPKSAADWQNWIVETSNVPFGSNVKVKRQDEVFLDDAELSDDGKTVSLIFEEHEPVTNLRIEYRIEAADGTELSNVIYGTINKIPE